MGSGRLHGTFNIAGARSGYERAVFSRRLQHAGVIGRITARQTAQQVIVQIDDA